MPTEVEIDAVINTDRSEYGLRQLNKSLKELISLQSQVAKGSEQFKRLQNAINDVEGKIGDLKDSFDTLRGSGVERLNASLGLLREGLLSADPEKISIGFNGLGAAMSAIPIFLLIEGVKLLVENFQKLLDMIITSRKEAILFADALEKLDRQVKNNLTVLDAYVISLEGELKVLKAQKAPLEEVLRLQGLINSAKKTALTNEIAQGETQILLNKKQIENLKADLVNLMTSAGGNFGFARLFYGSKDEILAKVKEFEDANAKIEASNYKARRQISAEAEAAEAERITRLKENLKHENQIRVDLLRQGYERIEEGIEQNRIKEKAAEKLRYDEALENAIANGSSIALENSLNSKKLNDIDKVYDEKLKALWAERASEFNRLKALEVEANEALNAQKIADDQAARDKENKEIIEQGRFELLWQQKMREQDREIEAINEADRRLRQKNNQAWNVAFQEETLQQKITFIQQDRDAQLLNEELTQRQRVEIIRKAEKDILDLKIKSATDYATIAEQGIMGIQAISDIAFEIQSSRLKKGSKEEDDAARKKFNINKGLQLANAAIQGTQATLAAFSSGAAIPIAGVVAGPAFAAVAAAVAIANIAKISNTQYKSSLSSSPASDSTPSVGSFSSTPSFNQTPSFNPSAFDPTGTANVQTNLNEPEPVKVYVLESDIRNVTNKVNVIETRATFP